MLGTDAGARRTEVAVRRASPAEAAAIWQQLLRGDWGEVDRIDDGCGRRLVLARFSRSRPRPWHLLSRREKSVVAAVAAGRSNRQIAELLGISVSTVAGHLRTARKKLGDPSRLDLVREWGSSCGSEVSG
jgi:DNA-binding CsgD family transcriptional regulator